MFNIEKFTGWPSGDNKPVLEVKSTPYEFSKRYHLEFHRDLDDLDYFLGSHLLDAKIGYIVMMRHENSLSEGVILYVDSKVDTVDAIYRIKEILVLSDDDVNWAA